MADDEGDDEIGGADISDAPFEMMQQARLAAGFLSHGGGAVPIDSNGLSWNKDFITTTGNVVFDLLHNFHLECGARLHKLRVYETLSDPTGREVCGYLLVRGSVHAHAYALALKEAHRRLDRADAADAEHSAWQHPGMPEVSAGGLAPEALHLQSSDYKTMSGIWGNGEVALPDDPPGELEVVEACRKAARSTSSSESPRPSRRIMRGGDVRDRAEADEEDAVSADFMTGLDPATHVHLP